MGSSATKLRKDPKGSSKEGKKKTKSKKTTRVTESLKESKEVEGQLAKSEPEVVKSEAGANDEDSPPTIHENNASPTIEQIQSEIIEAQGEGTPKNAVEVSVADENSDEIPEHFPKNEPVEVAKSVPANPEMNELSDLELLGVHISSSIAHAFTVADEENNSLPPVSPDCEPDEDLREIEDDLFQYLSEPKSSRRTSQETQIGFRGLKVNGKKSRKGKPMQTKKAARRLSSRRDADSADREMGPPVRAISSKSLEIPSRSNSRQCERPNQDNTSKTSSSASVHPDPDDSEDVNSAEENPFVQTRKPRSHRKYQSDSRYQRRAYHCDCGSEWFMVSNGKQVRCHKCHQLVNPWTDPDLEGVSTRVKLRGYFWCPNDDCGCEWNHYNTYINTPEKCSKCDTITYPYIQMPPTFKPVPRPSRSESKA